MVCTLLKNRHFHVELSNKQSRWHKQWNGQPQGSVLAPLLFLIYTNDQTHLSWNKKLCLCNDLAVAAQHKEFSEIEVTLSAALNNLTTYYEKNQPTVNPAKTQTCLFHSDTDKPKSSCLLFVKESN